MSYISRLCRIGMEDVLYIEVMYSIIGMEAVLQYILRLCRIGMEAVLYIEVM